MLRTKLTLLSLVAALLAGVSAAAAPPTTAAPPDSVVPRDPWLVRGLNRWFASRNPAPPISPQDVTQPGEAPFLPYAGRTIRQIEVRQRKAFGAVVPDSSSGPDWLLGAARLTATPLESMLNDLYTGTRPAVVGNYLLFHVGEPLDPFALADTERLLREAAYINDARIEVLPAADGTDAVDIVILVRDRWPYGADLKVLKSDRYDLTLYHRNVIGYGLDLQTRLLFDAAHTPQPGHESRLIWSNIGGSFADARISWRRAWDRDERSVMANRALRYPGVRLVGGFGAGLFEDHTLEPAIPGREVAWRTADAWIGRALVVQQDEAGRRPRRRLVPALSIGDLYYARRPQVDSLPRTEFLNHTQYLAGLTLVGWESYRTSFVYGYGETEDIPTGLWLSLVGGYEDCECRDRLYHGLSLLVPRILPGGNYLSAQVAWGGYRRRGRVEDGVLDARISTFTRLGAGAGMLWRHFLEMSYTRGVNRTRPDGIALDEQAGVRGLTTDAPRGNQRLQLSAESVAFTPLAPLGFKLALYAFADAGLVSDTEAPLFDSRLVSSLGVGLRIKNPGLVFPTLRIRLANIHTDGGWDTIVSVGSTSGGTFDFSVPDVRPAVVPYR